MKDNTAGNVHGLRRHLAQDRSRDYHSGVAVVVGIPEGSRGVGTHERTRSRREDGRTEQDERPRDDLLHVMVQDPADHNLCLDRWYERLYASVKVGIKEEWQG